MLFPKLAAPAIQYKESTPTNLQKNLRNNIIKIFKIFKRHIGFGETSEHNTVAVVKKVLRSITNVYFHIRYKMLTFVTQESP